MKENGMRYSAGKALEAIFADEDSHMNSLIVDQM